MSLLYVFVSVIVLLAVSAFYVAAEFASVAAKNVKIEAMAEDGDFLAKLLLPHIKDANSLDRYVATCQIGITVCSLLLGAIGESYLTPIVGPWIKSLTGPEPLGLSMAFWKPAFSAVVIISFTVLQLIFGELLPKAVAVRYSERVALLLTIPMIWSLKVFGIFIDVFNGSSELLLKALGVKLVSERHVHSPEELSSLVEHTGEINEKEQMILERMLRFDDRCVRDIMIPRNFVQSVDIATPREEILEMVVKSPYTRFPVYEGRDDNIIGILHLKDLLHADLKSQKNKPSSLAALKKKIRPVVFCPSSLGVDKVWSIMRKQRIYLAVLIDEYGGYDGIITIEDIIEEVLGEIHDEFDVDIQNTEEIFRELQPGEYLVSGPMLIDNLAENYDIELTAKGIDTERVHTVGGLVMHLLGDVPEVGTAVECDQYQLTVTKMERRQVINVRINRKEAVR